MYLVKSNDLPKSARQLQKEGKKRIKSARRNLTQSGRRLSDQFQEWYPEIISNLRDFSSRAADQTRQLAGIAGRELGAVGGRAIRYTDTSVVKLGALYALFKWLQSSYPEVNEATEKVKRHIEEKPVESALIAAGVGYLIGRLLRW